MSQNAKYYIIRGMVCLSITGLFILLLYWAFIKTLPDLTISLKSGDQVLIADYLRNAGSIKGMLSLALLQIVQVISIVLASIPIQIAAGIVYGWLRGFIVCHLSSTFAHMMVFFWLRKLDTKLNRLIPGKKKASKLDFVIGSNYPGYMLLIAFLIPLIPRGLLPYIAARTKITLIKYVLTVFFGNFIPVLIYCSIGYQILYHSYMEAVLLFAVLLVVSFLLYKFRDQVLAFLKHTLPRLFHEEIKNGEKPAE